jgi:CheY-like chemotaxis protein
MPDPDGLELLRAIKAEWPDVPMIMLSTFENSAYVRRALADGAAGYLLKDATLLSEGRSNRSIAQNLYVSEKTVKAHLAAIFRKLGVTNRTQAAMMAVQDDGRPDGRGHGPGRSPWHRRGVNRGCTRSRLPSIGRRSTRRSALIHRGAIAERPLHSADDPGPQPSCDGHWRWA